MKSIFFNNQNYLPNFYQIGAYVGMLAITAVALGAGAYFTHSLPPAACYAAMGVGGGVFISDVALLAFWILRRTSSILVDSKKLNSRDPPIESDEEVIAQTATNSSENNQLIAGREDSINFRKQRIDNYSLQYLEEYASYELENVKKLLEDYSKQNECSSGDYVVGRVTQFEFKVFYLDESLEIQEFLFTNPNIAKKYFIDDFDKLKRPIIPSELHNKINPTEVHDALLYCRNKSLMNDLDLYDRDNQNQEITIHRIKTIGFFHYFLDWLKEHDGKVRFNPNFFLSCFGHIFSFKGRFSFNFTGSDFCTKSTTVDFEGFNGYCAKNIIMQEILNYIPKLKVDEEKQEKIALMCNHAYTVGQGQNPSLETLLQLYKNGVPITVMTGWYGHSINITLGNGYLLLNNKGEGSEDNPGMIKYKISTEVTLESLSQLMQLREKKCFSRNSNSQNDLEKIFGLEFQEVVTSRAQTTGNCTFASNFGSLQAALIILGSSKEDAKSIYKQFKHEVRLNWLSTMLELVDKYSEEELQSQLFFTLAIAFVKSYFKMSYSFDVKKRNNEMEIAKKIFENALRLRRSGSKSPYLLYIVQLATNQIKPYGSNYFLQHCNQSQWQESNQTTEPITIEQGKQLEVLKDMADSYIVQYRGKGR